MGIIIDFMYENPTEALAAYDIRVHRENLDADIAGFVYKSRKNIYHIVINNNLNWRAQTEVFLHELSHIKDDLPETGYIIGLDMRHHHVEELADWAAKETARAYGY
ncbi:hypothetical protein [Desulfitobacterium chlororespirans]|uniref:IrrE N-terminal-like domain-containing protein n=1 Tax=Desulfitobacterium chlororespirans DSM 11544 TaxID=1121395 RepID=A0A1M7UYC3_9FIRM|nr:hypothetical protein [Desulfitobacterium chlororespirans]SHN87993.1 hypothetical protein SAMN02745215_05074 [Desulfitobacterium chlororespirans DSM 11544]